MRPVDPSNFKRQISCKLPQFGGLYQEDAYEFLVALMSALHDEMASAVVHGNVAPTVVEVCPSDWEPRMMKLQQACPEVDRNLLIKVLKEHNGIAGTALAAIRDLKEAGRSTTEVRGQNKPRHEPEVVTQKHFHSQMEETFKCESCGHAFVVKNDLSGFSLPVRAHGHSGCELQDMLAGYFQNENHPVPCARCGVETIHTLHKKLSSWPPALILHMKRDAENGHFSRYADVNIPKRLAAHEDPSKVYRLRSVVSRSGSSTEFGHYTWYVLDENDTWTSYNDAHVSSSSGREPSGRNAHILFYASDPLADLTPLTPEDAEEQYAQAVSSSKLIPVTQEDAERQYELAVSNSKLSSHIGGVTETAPSVAKPADGKLATRATAANIHTKSDAKLVAKANASDVYSQTQVDDKLATQADAANVPTEGETYLYNKSQSWRKPVAKTAPSDVYSQPRGQMTQSPQQSGGQMMQGRPGGQLMQSPQQNGGKMMQPPQQSGGQMAPVMQQKMMQGPQQDGGHILRAHQQNAGQMQRQQQHGGPMMQSPQPNAVQMMQGTQMHGGQMMQCPQRGDRQRMQSLGGGRMQSPQQLGNVPMSRLPRITLPGLCCGRFPREDP